jgi:hypothetical protein
MLFYDTVLSSILELAARHLDLVHTAYQISFKPYPDLKNNELL